MSTGIFSIGVSGLSAAQLGLLATEHNVVNANTPGYTRQATVQATNVAINTGAGSIGQGVHVQTVKRMYDQFLSGQVNSAQSQVSELDSYYAQISQIDIMLADPEAGLSPSLQDFFSGVQQVASNPSLLPARQSMIASAQTLATRFHNIDSRLSELKAQVNDRIANAVTEINTFAAQIADINQRIVVSEGSYGQPANDLLDQRDLLVSELGKLIKVSTSTNTDGSYNVYIGSGQQLVVGARFTELTATASTADPSRIVVGLKTASGTLEYPESLITGGELGGLVDFRRDSLDLVINELGRVATSLALTFNAQHGLGQDLHGRIEGDTGFVGDFFTISDPKVISHAYNTGAGNLTASFMAPVAPTAPDYSGNFYTELTTSDYRVQFGAAGAYSITRLGDNQVVASGSGVGVVTFDGVSLNISAVGNDGDKFVIQPVSEVARNIGVDTRITADPRLVAAAAPVRVSPGVTNTGSMSISQGVVGVGYSVPASPLTLTATATTLNGVGGTWTAVYSNGSTSTSTGNIPLTSGTETLSKVVFSGMSFDVKGTPAVGDQFVVQRNTSGVQDGRNAVLFAKLQTQNTVSDGTATFQSAYARLVADNGIRAREAKVQLDAQSAIRDQAVATRESLSGVNLDEEAANMLKYQQAYQAASKILEIGNKMFDTILSLG
jgi:flagellar hook-associated protein 1 FlgK